MATLGRPTKYHEDMPGKVLEMMSDGWSVNAVCTELKITPDTFFRWCREYEEFSYAYKMGRSAKARWYENEGRQNLNTKDYNSLLFSMTARACGGLNTDERVAFVDFDGAETWEEKAKRVSDAVNARNVTPKEAERLMNIIERGQKISEVHALASRVEELESKLKES